jgi:putative transposase
MKKSNQNQPADATAPAVPERVSVAMAEIAENMQEGLLALAVGAGLHVMQALMEADVAALAGPNRRRR